MSMIRLRSKSKLVALVAAIILVALIIGVAKHGSNKSGSQTAGKSGQTAGQTNQTPVVSVTSENIETADFKYQKPEGWAILSQSVLDSSSATSGIGRDSKPFGVFTIKVASATPSSNDELKNSTLNELKKLLGYTLVSSGDTKIDGKPGQKFTYTFQGKFKDKGQLNVVVYKQKTFFLLLWSAEPDFDKQTSDFANILANFHFK